MSNQNTAVQHCLFIWQQEFDKCRAEEKSNYDASLSAHQKFRKAMPDLSGKQNIQDFIACIGRGILIGAINSREGSKLLYAAQVASQAQMAIRREEKSVPKVAKLLKKAVA